MKLQQHLVEQLTSLLAVMRKSAKATLLGMFTSSLDNFRTSTLSGSSTISSSRTRMVPVKVGCDLILRIQLSAPRFVQNRWYGSERVLDLVKRSKF